MNYVEAYHLDTLGRHISGDWLKQELGGLVGDQVSYYILGVVG